MHLSKRQMRSLHKLGELKAAATIETDGLRARCREIRSPGPMRLPRRTSSGPRLAGFLVSTAAVLAWRPRRARRLPTTSRWATPTRAGREPATTTSRTASAATSPSRQLIDPQLPGTTSAWPPAAGRRPRHIDRSGQNGNADAGSIRLGADTEYVSISIGGNDAGFTDVLLECGQPASRSRTAMPAVDGAQDTINNMLPGRSTASTTRSARRRRTPRDVVGYPRIFNGEDCNAATFFNEGEMNRLNQTADLLADVDAGAGAGARLRFADARGASSATRPATTRVAQRPLNPTGESFHPNKLGHDSYEGIVGSALLAQAAPTDVRGPNGRIAFTRGPAGARTSSRSTATAASRNLTSTSRCRRRPRLLARRHEDRLRKRPRRRQRDLHGERRRHRDVSS